MARLARCDNLRNSGHCRQAFRDALQLQSSVNRAVDSAPPQPAAAAEGAAEAVKKDSAAHCSQAASDAACQTVDTSGNGQHEDRPTSDSPDPDSNAVGTADTAGNAAQAAEAARLEAVRLQVWTIGSYHK